VCVGKKILKNASSRVARAFKDSMKNNQKNQSGMFLYLTQVKAVLFAVINFQPLRVIGFFRRARRVWYRDYTRTPFEMAWHAVFMLYLYGQQR